MSFKKIPITIINGYLGSGKTTLVNQVLNNKEKLRVAVIVNDLGEINIDASLIKEESKKVQIDTSIVELSNGCICCSLKNDLIVELYKLLKSNKYDHIIIESSGITEPAPVVSMIYSSIDEIGKSILDYAYINAIITVLDLYRTKMEFNLGKDLEEHGNNNHHDIANLIIEQLEFSSMIVLNKRDLVSTKELNLITSYVKLIQPKAKLIEATYSNVALKLLLNNNKLDLKEVLNSPSWLDIFKENKHEHNHDHLEEYGITTFIYESSYPFSDVRLLNVYNNLPKNIARSKGIISINTDLDNSYLVSQAGKSVIIEEFKKWNFLEKESTIEEFFENRKTKFVVIGIDINKDEIIKLFDSALLTKEEREISFLEYKNKL